MASCIHNRSSPVLLVHYDSSKVYTGSCNNLYANDSQSPLIIDYPANTQM